MAILLLHALTRGGGESFREICLVSLREDSYVSLGVFLLQSLDVLVAWSSEDVENHVQLIAIASGVKSEDRGVKKESSDQPRRTTKKRQEEEVDWKGGKRKERESKHTRRGRNNTGG